MDPAQCWNDMLVAHATKQWQEAREHAEALRDWLEKGGFAPQPTVGTTNMRFTCQPDEGISAAICQAACNHILTTVDSAKEECDAAC